MPKRLLIVSGSNLIFFIPGICSHIQLPTIPKGTQAKQVKCGNESPDKSLLGNFF